MILFIFFILEIFSMYVIRLMFQINTIDGIILLFINLTVFLMWIITNKKITNTQRVLLIISVLVKSILLILSRDVIELPYSKDDANSFNSIAASISNNLSLLGENTPGGIFGKVLGILYYFIGENRLFAQTINAFISTIALYNIFICINMMKIKDDRKTEMLQKILVFLPQTILLSIALLREAVIIYFISVSLKYCMYYLKSKKKKYIIVCLSSVILASVFHAGTLFLNVGYIILFSFYDSKKCKYNLSTKKITIFIFLIIIMIILYIKFGNIIANKFTSTSEETMIKNIELTNSGGSAYLGGKTINGIGDIIIYSIPKTIYFLFSPMLWDCRNTLDLFSFATDSLVYIYLIFNILHKRKNISCKYKSIFTALIIGTSICIVIFALGTANAGTAIRHRHKIFELLVFMNIICCCEKEKKDSNYIL